MRASLWSAVLPVVVLTLPVAACSSGDAPAPAPSAIGRTSSAIINGQVDTTHQAVVAVAMQSATESALCSGTIVKTDPARHIGWVLVAAHCVNEIPPVAVLQGNDFQAPARILYDVLDYKADSRYPNNPGSPYDFAVIRILGVDASTPTIPLVSADDGLSAGSAVLSVGYGRTTLMSAGPADDNSVRHHVAKQLGQVGQMLSYDMQSDGICSGDSGGPVLVTTGGVEKVAGVHSYVEGDCDGTGVSGRVSFDLSFINGELAKALPADSCALCTKTQGSGNLTCASLSSDCLADTQCAGYYDCISSKSAAACAKQFPKGEGPYSAAVNCACDQACTTQCAGALQCASVPKCGYKQAAGACATCTESSCCDEELACAADGTCYQCLKTGDSAAECATSSARKALRACVASKCATDCTANADPASGDPSDDADGGDSSGAGDGAVTSTTSGCSVSPSRGKSGLSSSGGASAGFFLVSAIALSLRTRRRRQRAGGSPPSSVTSD
jgi:hypothetical protein